MICGFELGSTGEFYALNGAGAANLTVQSSIVRTGSYALKSLPTSTDGGAQAVLARINSSGLVVADAKTIRFYLYVTGTGGKRLVAGTNTSSTTISGTTPPANCWFLYYTPSSGAWDLYTNTTSTSGTLQLNTGEWNMVEIVVNASGGNTATLLVNGLQVGSAIATAGAVGYLNLGHNSGTNTDAWYYDDVRTTTENSKVGEGRALILLPTADPGALNSWTNGGGGTTSIFQGVNNVPPIGAAASTDGTKIKNAASGGNLDYTPTMQTYIAAGVPVGSRINAVKAIINDGEEAGTATKVLQAWIASNPADTTGVSFNAGDDVGALGTFPTGWKTHWDTEPSNPTVTLTTAPTMTVRKVTSTTRVVDVDFMGIYVDYTPPNPLTGSSAPIANAFPQIVRT